MSETTPKNDIVNVDSQKLPAIEHPTPMQIIQQMVAQGADADNLGKMLELQMTWEANEAKKAYVRAMTEFRKNPPIIRKTANVSYGEGSKATSFSFAPLDQVAAAIGDAMAPHGLSFHWQTDTGDGGISVTCVIMHEMGHSEQSPLKSAPDSSGGKNSIQAIGSAVSYLQRYTLLAAAGIAATNADDDGKSADQKETLSDEQCTELLAMCTDAGMDDAKAHHYLGKLAKRFGISMYTDIHAENFEAAKEILSGAVKAWLKKQGAENG